MIIHLNIYERACPQRRGETIPDMARMFISNRLMPPQISGHFSKLGSHFCFDYSQGHYWQYCMGTCYKANSLVAELNIEVPS